MYTIYRYICTYVYMFVLYPFVCMYIHAYAHIYAMTHFDMCHDRCIGVDSFICVP